MDTDQIRKIRLFFLRSFIEDISGGVDICFREKGIKFEEKGAILVDETTHSHLSVGDVCLLADDRYFDSDHYELDDVKEYQKEVAKKAPMVVLAFFELKAVMSRIKRPVVVRKIFCATGKVWVEKTEWERKMWGWVPEPHKITIGSLPIVINNTELVDSKNYVRLFQADLLKKCEDSSEEQKQ